MATHNTVSLLAAVVLAPKSKETIDGVKSMVGLKTVMSERDFSDSKTGYQLRCVPFVAMSKEQKIVDIISGLQLYDVIEIKGFIATKEVDKSSKCPNCGAENRRVEACVAHGKEKSGGNIIYIYPIFIEVRQHFNSEQDAFLYLHEKKENANSAIVLGNLTGEPVQGVLQEGKKRYTRYQLAINRKYCAKGSDETEERTDYPWIYSYGEKSDEDFQRLNKGSLVLVDGALQARKYKEQYICQNCQAEYDVPGRTLEILSYDTEFLRDPKPKEETDEESKEDSEE